jgi:hypothetical protein
MSRTHRTDQRTTPAADPRDTIEGADPIDTLGSEYDDDERELQFAYSFNQFDE